MTKARKSKVLKRRMLLVWRTIQGVFLFAFMIGLVVAGLQIGRVVTHTPANCTLTDTAEVICN